MTGLCFVLRMAVSRCCCFLCEWFTGFSCDSGYFGVGSVISVDTTLRGNWALTGVLILLHRGASTMRRPRCLTVRLRQTMMRLPTRRLIEERSIICIGTASGRWRQRNSWF